MNQGIDTYLRLLFRRSQQKNFPTFFYTYEFSMPYNVYDTYPTMSIKKDSFWIILNAYEEWLLAGEGIV